MRENKRLLSTAGFEGLVLTEHNVFHSQKKPESSFERSSRFSFHSFMAIQSSFIHVPHFPEWIFSCFREGERDGTSRDCLHFAFALFFPFDCSFLSLPRIHLGAGLTPPTHPSNLYDRCFSFSFSKPNFSLRKISIFSFSPRKDENFLHLQLFGALETFKPSTRELSSLLSRGGQL